MRFEILVLVRIKGDDFEWMDEDTDLTKQRCCIGALNILLNMVLVHMTREWMRAYFAKTLFSVS